MADAYNALTKANMTKLAKVIERTSTSHREWVIEHFVPRRTAFNTRKTELRNYVEDLPDNPATQIAKDALERFMPKSTRGRGAADPAEKLAGFLAGFDFSDDIAEGEGEGEGES